jgi:hypothetical protein
LEALLIIAASLPLALLGTHLMSQLPTSFMCSMSNCFSQIMFFQLQVITCHYFSLELSAQLSHGDESCIDLSSFHCDILNLLVKFPFISLMAYNSLTLFAQQWVAACLM